MGAPLPHRMKTAAGPQAPADYTQRMAHPSETRRGPEPPDISEKGGMKHGQPQRSDVRLFMQFLAFGGCPDPVAPEAQPASGKTTKSTAIRLRKTISCLHTARSGEPVPREQ